MVAKYEMKDSGFQDIGIYPAHWRLLKVKNCFTIFCGATPTEEPENWGGRSRLDKSFRHERFWHDL